MRSVYAGVRRLVIPYGAAPLSPHYVSGPDVPAELEAYYNGGTYNFRVVYAERWHFGAGAPPNPYYYEVALEDHPFAPTRPRGRGWVIGGTVYEADFESHFTGPARRNYKLGGLSPADQVWLIGDPLASPSPLRHRWEAGRDVDVVVDETSQGRGLVGSGIATTTLGPFGAPTVVLSTAAAVTCRAGRAYAVEIDMNHFSSAVGILGLYTLVRAGGGGFGQSLGNWRTEGGASTRVTARTIVTRTGTDLTDTLQVTAAPSAGTLSAFGSASTPRLITVRDIGAAADFAGFPAIT